MLAGINEMRRGTASRECRVAIVAAVVVALGAFLPGCTSGKTVNIDPRSGYFPSEWVDGDSDVVSIVRSSQFDLDQLRGLVVVPDRLDTHRRYEYHREFMLKAIEQIGYFGEVITYGELLARAEGIDVEGEGLVTAIDNRDEEEIVRAITGIYKPFLWLRWGHRQEGIGERGDEFHQLVLTVASSLEDIFVVEVPYLYASVDDGGLALRVGDYLASSSRGQVHNGAKPSGHRKHRRDYHYGHYGRGYYARCRWGRCWRHFGGIYISSYYDLHIKRVQRVHNSHIGIGHGYHWNIHPYAVPHHLYPHRYRRTTTHERHHYPMLNAFIDYIKANSKTWQGGVARSPAPSAPEPTPAQPSTAP